MKKLTKHVHKFVDFEVSEMPTGFETKLRDLQIFTYRDMILKEHIYSIDAVRELMEEDPELFHQEEIKMLDRLSAILTKEGCGYFRFVS